MSERTFTITLSDEQRLTVINALSFSLGQLAVHPVTAAVREPIIQLIGQLSEAKGKDSGAEAARAILQPIHQPNPPVDYFARDRKGNVPMNPPEGAELRNVRIIQATEVPAKSGKAGFLQVIFSAANPKDGGKANCFESQLWNAIRNRLNQPAELWILQSGNYLNIVGVRA